MKLGRPLFFMGMYASSGKRRIARFVKKKFTMSKILLHACCGPCSIVPLKRLKADGHDITVLFFNPNIHPLQEYLRRREGMAEVAAHYDVPVIFLDREYTPQNWFQAISFREANRCFYCYEMRLKRTLSIARKGNFDAISSTLLYSKQQKHEVIAKLGQDICGGGAVQFLYRDFRDGWQEGIEISKEWGIYRQPYCGCLYSENERYARELRAVCDEDKAQRAHAGSTTSNKRAASAENAETDAQNA